MSTGSEDRLISAVEFEWGVIRKEDIADIEWICTRLQKERARLTGVRHRRRARTDPPHEKPAAEPRPRGSG